MNEKGNYAAELVSSVPPYRDLCSGSLNSADATEAWRLALATLTSVATEAPVQPPNRYVGFVVPVGIDDKQVSPYYFYPQDDKRDSTRNFVQLVLIIDSYVKTHYRALIDKDDNWK